MTTYNSNAQLQDDLRRWTFPEEDRHLFTTTPWDGCSFRWFRATNIVCLEQYRRSHQCQPK